MTTMAISQPPSLDDAASGLSSTSNSPIPELTQMLKVERVISSGSHGTVYCVIHEMLQVKYAVKVQRLPENIEKQQRVILEGQRMAKLDHPNVVRFYGCWPISGHYDDVCPAMEEDIVASSTEFSTIPEVESEKHTLLCIQMELCDSNLMDAFREGSSTETLVVYCSQVAAGLEYLHNLNIIHNDIKPANILIKNNVAKIGDFGLCSTEHNSPVSGTPMYQAPCGVGSRAADIYSFGLVLLECVCSSIEDRVQLLAQARRHGKLPEPTLRFPMLAKLRSLLLDMLSHDPMCRPSISKVATELHYATASSSNEQCIPIEQCKLFASMIVDACVVADSSGCIIANNIAAERMFSYEEGKMLQLTVHDLVPESMRAQHRKWFDAYQQTGERHLIGTRRTVPCQLQDGSTRPISLSLGDISGALFAAIMQPDVQRIA